MQNVIDKNALLTNSPRNNLLTMGNINTGASTDLLME